MHWHWFSWKLEKKRSGFLYYKCSKCGKKKVKPAGDDQYGVLEEAWHRHKKKEKEGL